MFDLLMSADMMLADPDGMAALLVSKLGIHGHPRWRQAFDDHPYIAHFLRVHKSLAIAPLQLPPEAFATPAPQLPNAEPGQMVRVTARGWLVRNLDDTLGRLSANLDWEPTGSVRKLVHDGYRQATMGFGLANSATLD